MLKRTVIKLSGEALAGSCRDFDDTVIDTVIRQIKTVLAAGTQVALVVGGGNFWRGRSHDVMDRVKADQIGMLATVMNAIYLAEAFKKQGTDAQVVTPLEFGHMTMVYERDTALRHMAAGTVLINAAGLGHPFFSTDTITALRAAELQADCVLYAKSIDGVYDCDPRRHPHARKYRQLTYRTAMANLLAAADMAAMHVSNEARMPSYIFGLDAPDAIINACAYPETRALEGTYIHVEVKEDFYVNTHEAL